MEQLPHGQCPNCRCPLQYFPDIKTNREIESLLVYCHQKMSGCKWQGELREIEQHDGKCKQRKYHCLKCNEEGEYCNITSQKHTDVCPGVIVGCPNDGCDKKVKRGELATHRGVCLQEVVTCTYHNIGCSERMKRKDIAKHKESSMGLHLGMAIKRIEEKTCKEAGEPVCGLKEREVVFTMKNFQNLKDTNTDWYSPGFYTSPGGYKMSLRVCPNGNGTGEGTHLSCFTCLMPGEYDDTLEWPFRGKVTVKLLNQEEDNNHHSMTIVYGENNITDCSRVIEKPYGSGWGNPKFLSHTDLYNSPIAVNSPIVYIKNDTLYFRITVANKNKTKPWLAVAL